MLTQKQISEALQALNDSLGHKSLKGEIGLVDGVRCVSLLMPEKLQKTSTQSLLHLLSAPLQKRSISPLNEKVVFSVPQTFRPERE